MKIAKAIAVVIVVAIGAALIAASTSAQSPSATPTATIARFTISEEPPQYWTAEGGTQASWMAFRQRCADIGAELTRRRSMTSNWRLRPDSRSAEMKCFAVHISLSLPGTQCQGRHFRLRPFRLRSHGPR
jgi:hypothetical protein